MKHLNSALENLKSSIDTYAWLDGLVKLIKPKSKQETNIRALEEGMQELLTPILTSLFSDINRSILSGEYTSSISNARKILDEIKDYIRSIANFEIQNQPTLTIASQAYFTDTFYNTIDNAIKQYNTLLFTVDLRLNFEPDTVTLFNAIKKYEKVIGEEQSQLLKILRCNIELSILDHNLRFDDDTIQKLILLNENLTDIGATGSIIEILIKKCDFLLTKLWYRLDKSKTTRYGIDFAYRDIKPKSIDEFNYYDCIIKGNYTEDVRSDGFRTRHRLAEKKFLQEPTNLTFDDYHALAKYYKDIEEDLEKLIELRDCYKKLYDSTKSNNNNDLQKKANELLFCYLENNLLSLELKKGVFTLDNWKTHLNEFTKRASSLKNINFFPHFKIIEDFLTKEIDNQFLKEHLDLELIDKLIKGYDENLKEFSNKLRICEQTNYMTFQLNYDDCIIDMKDKLDVNWNCFVASSFVLPLNYNEKNKDVNRYHSDLTKYRAMYDIHKSIKSDKEKIIKIAEKVSSSDKRHVEILSIFAAIVMFVSGEIQIFTKLNNITDAFIFTMFFAFSLGLFILLVWFVTRPTSIDWKNRFPWLHFSILFLFILGFIAGIFLITKYDSVERTLINKIKNRDNQLDSVRNRYKIDSILLEQRKLKK